MAQSVMHARNCMENHPQQDPFQTLQNQIPVDLLKVRRVLAWLLPVLILVVAAYGAVYTVQPEGKAVVKRFGKVVSIREPGLHFKLPFGIDTARFVPTERVLKEEFGFRTTEPGERTRYQKQGYEEESLMLSGDLNVIDVEWVVQFRIKDPDKFLHRVRDQRETIRDVSEAVMRRIVGNRLGSDVLTVGRVEIAALARDEMQEILDSYDSGVHVATVELQDVTPPNPVKPAFNEVNEARQQKERLINEAEKRRNQEVPRAKGEAQQIIANAEGYAAERVNIAKGEASRFEAVLKEYLEAPAVTRRRIYLESMDDILSRVENLYIVQEGQFMPLPLLNLPEADGVAPKSGGKP